MSRFPSSPHLFAALVVFVGAACESPAAPAPCGPLPQVTVNVGERSSVAACFNDESGDVLSYTATSSNPAVAKASISDTSITVTGVAPGDATVAVTATNTEGLQGQQSFAVMVPNRAPQPRGTVPGVTVEVDATATVDASQYFSEPDGEALTYAAGASDTAVASVSVAGSTITVTANAKGGATITTTASDPGGLSATQTFGVTVPNRAPKPVGAIDAQKIKVGQPVLFDVASAFADPDGDSLTYTVATPDDSVVFTIVTSDGRLVLHGLAVGTTTLTVTAQDPDGLTATQSFVLTVAPALTRLTFHSETDASPDWSQDGIFFDSDRHGSHEIHVMDEDGSDIERLTNDRSGDREPSWSPDGTRIAFHSDRDGNDEIYVMNEHGSGVTRLTNDGALDRHPVWSPDANGARIAFISSRDGNDEIYVMQIKLGENLNAQTGIQHVAVAVVGRSYPTQRRD